MLLGTTPPWEDHSTTAAFLPEMTPPEVSLAHTCVRPLNLNLYPLMLDSPMPSKSYPNLALNKPLASLNTSIRSLLNLLLTG